MLSITSFSSVTVYSWSDSFWSSLPVAVVCYSALWILLFIIYNSQIGQLYTLSTTTNVTILTCSSAIMLNAHARFRMLSSLTIIFFTERYINTLSRSDQLDRCWWHQHTNRITIQEIGVRCNRSATKMRYNVMRSVFTGRLLGDRGSC